MMNWFFASQESASSTVSNNFSVGGQYAVVMHLPTGDYRHFGEYRTIRRYSHIAFSWNSHLVQDSLVALDFRELSSDRTELTLTHTQFPDLDVRGRHLGGWERCLDNLERFVAARLPL
jgi:uncharacterized protein YndB with AHSA1/START domain